MTIIEDYQARTAALSAATATRVAGIYAALQAGHLTADEAEKLIAATINAGNAASFTLADAYVAIQIEQLTGTPTPATGISPSDGLARLEKAVHTVIGALEAMVAQAESAMAASDPVQTAGMRLERIAHSEPLEAAQNAAVTVMTAHPMVEGWTRQMDADPCQLCQWWARDGRIWPKNHPFPSHKGCNCQPKVVLAERIQSTDYTRRLERAAARTGTQFTR